MFRTLALALVAIPVCWAAGADARWHVPDSPERAIVRIELPAAGETVGQPVEIALPAGAADSFRAWDLKGTGKLA